MSTETKAATVTFKAEFDSEANMWWVSECSYPGVNAEAPTLDRLYKKVQAVVADLREINGDTAPAGMMQMSAEMPMAA
ncbi:DUF1902 domain-containing protein [Rhodovarius crocodyli]|nr:DUF1902 domain-containing protein [Rhodovarius crocodyli]